MRAEGVLTATTVAEGQSGCGYYHRGVMQAYWVRSRKTAAPTRYFRCASYERGRVPARCRTQRQHVPAGTVEQAVWSALDEMLSQPGVLRAAIEARRASDTENAPILDDQIKRTQQKLEKLLEAWDEARRLRYAGEVEAGEFARDKEYFDAEIDGARQELVRLQALEAEHERHASVLELDEQIVERWEAVRAELTAEEKAQVIWTLVSDVTIDREDHMVITRTFGETDGSNIFGYGGRYWIRTSDLCDVNAAL